MTTAANNQQNNNNNEEEKLCRICYGTDEDSNTTRLYCTDQEWVHPCQCSGSIKWVHRGCFGMWHGQASAQQRYQCNVCSYSYRFSSRLKPRWYAELPIIYWALILLYVTIISGLFYCIATLDFFGIFLYTVMSCSFLLGTKVGNRLRLYLGHDEAGMAELLGLTLISYALFEQSIQNAE